MHRLCLPANGVVVGAILLGGGKKWNGVKVPTPLGVRGSLGGGVKIPMTSSTKGALVESGWSAITLTICSLASLCHNRITEFKLLLPLAPAPWCFLCSPALAWGVSDPLMSEAPRLFLGVTQFVLAGIVKLEWIQPQLGWGRSGSLLRAGQCVCFWTAVLLLTSVVWFEHFSCFCSNTRKVVYKFLRICLI